MLRSTFGACRPEQESFNIVTIACRVTEREQNQICRFIFPSFTGFPGCVGGLYLFAAY
jgi:hypothetical protein